MAHRVLTHMHGFESLYPDPKFRGGKFPGCTVGGMCVGEEEGEEEVQGQGESIPLTHVTSDNYCVETTISRTPYGVSKWLFRNIKEI